MTLLHHAVLKGINGKTQLLIDFVNKDPNLDHDIFMWWINSKTDGEGWTALHYAAFYGNLDAIYTLIDHKANVFELNNNGLNMLHVAA